MKKALYICRTNIEGKEELGVVKKILAQISALKNLQFSVDSLFADEQHVFHKTGSGKTTHNAFRRVKSTRRSLSSAISLGKRGWNGAINFEALYNEIDFKAYDLIYIRYYFANSSLAKFFKYLKKIKPGLRIILELPAYPYNVEMRNLKGGIVHEWVDKYWRRSFKKYVDLIVTFSNDKSIFGIPAVSITNGINPAEFKIKDHLPITKQIKIIGVGNISPWHGYDRLIKGIKIYKQNATASYQIRFYVVGTGHGLEGLQQLVKELEMENEVLFLGQKNKEELAVLYEEMHLGIGSLGLFRNNLTISSSLKHREYTAVGMPFILATKDLDFPEGTFFIKYVPDQETIIDVMDIIPFYEELVQKYGQELPGKIRGYAEENLSWDQRMKMIINNLPSH